MSYKVEGKDLITIDSITHSKKKIKDEAAEALNKILELMRKHNITKVECQ